MSDRTVIVTFKGGCVFGICPACRKEILLHEMLILPHFDTDSPCAGEGQFPATTRMRS